MATLTAYFSGAGEDDEELPARGALATQIASGDEVDFIDLRRDEGELLVVALREERNGLQRGDASISHLGGRLGGHGESRKAYLLRSLSEGNWRGFHRDQGIQESDIAP